jgi:hypothetical protein
VANVCSHCHRFSRVKDNRFLGNLKAFIKNLNFLKAEILLWMRAVSQHLNKVSKVGSTKRLKVGRVSSGERSENQV